MRTTDLTEDSPLLDALYDDLLRPSFRPEELISRAQLGALASAGDGVITVALDGEGAPAGTAIGEWSPGTGVLLLSYLAVRARERGAGTGTLLMGEVTAGWQDRFRPVLTLAEIQHPLAHGGGGRDAAAHGDPRARVRFYGRHGALALAVPYAQPALGHGPGRVYGMLLIALAGAEAAGRVAAAPVRAFVDAYYEGTEGAAARADPALRPMWDALDSGVDISLLPLEDPAVLPLLSPPD